MSVKKRSLKDTETEGHLPKDEIRAVVTGVHVLHKKGEGWAVKKGGRSRVFKSFSAKKQAVDYGRELSKKSNSRLIIHNQNGKIQSLSDYEVRYEKSTEEK